MKIKKLLCLVLVLLVVCCFLVGCGSTAGDRKEFNKFEDFESARLGTLSGSGLDKQTTEIFPNAKKYGYKSLVDLLVNLSENKIDGFLLDSAFYSGIGWEKNGYRAIESDKTKPCKFGFVASSTATGNRLNSELNEFIAQMYENGGTEKLAEKWFSGTRPTEFEDYESLTGVNGTIYVGMADTDPPFSYQDDKGLTGFDLEYIILFAKEYGYKIELSTVDLSFILGGVQSGKYDLGIGGIPITDERKEVLNFTECYYESPVVMVTMGYGDRISHLSDLSGKKVGVVTGSILAIMMPGLVPDAQYLEFNSVSDLIVALSSNRIDAFSCDESLYTSMLWKGLAVDRIDEPIGESNYGIIFPKGKKLNLQNEVNKFIADALQDGSLKALEDKWFSAKEPTEFVSYDNLSGTNGTITVAINSASMPFVYLKNNKYVGFDIEVITAFAKEYGYKIKFEDTAFASILGGVQSEKYDLGIAGITITDERKESMDFSSVYHVEDLAVIIKDEEGANSLTQFNTATLGFVSGSPYGGYSSEKFPNAKIKQFNNLSDVIGALKQGNIDGIMLDKPNYNSVARTDSKLKAIMVPEYTVDVGFGFQTTDNGNALKAQMNELLTKLDEDGTIRQLTNKWYGETEPQVSIPLEELTSFNKTLNVAIDTNKKPFVYMNDSKPTGFEIEVLYLFCKEYGYNLNLSSVSTEVGLSGLASGDYDIACGGLYMTDESIASVNFSNPYMSAEVVMVRYERSSFENFMLSLRESFEKTFIREQRWKLIIDGIGMTMFISLLSVLGGTLLGFALYMATRSKYKWISKISRGIAKTYSAIIAGTPTLVVLMFLFYVVFTSPDISGVVVAIVCFALTFGSYVYDNLELTVSGVDNGQKEAAYALGYSRNKTFFRIIMPQAMKMFVPGYSNEIVNLIKATSVVGYIAVNDLTKMGDIIRANTYEAFFPLIAVAVIYFALTWIITRLLGILRKKTEPKKRKNKNILKGVIR